MQSCWDHPCFKFPNILRCEEFPIQKIWTALEKGDHNVFQQHIYSDKCVSCIFFLTCHFSEYFPSFVVFFASCCYLHKEGSWCKYANMWFFSPLHHLSQLFLLRRTGHKHEKMNGFSKGKLKMEILAINLCHGLKQGQGSGDAASCCIIGLLCSG